MVKRKKNSGLEREIAAKLSECIGGLLSSSVVTACFPGYHSRTRWLVRRIDPGGLRGPAVSISQSSTQCDWQSRDKTTIILYYPCPFSQATLIRR